MNRRSRLAIYTAVYAILYTFFLYKNLRGITFPLFTIATLVLIFLCTKEFSLKWKKSSIVISVFTVLISISQPLTDKTFIHFFNVLFVYSMLIYIALCQFAFTNNWTFGQTVGNIFKTFFNSIANFFAPLKDLKLYQQSLKSADSQEKKKFPWLTVICTILATLPVLLIVTLMLSSADDVFSKMWKDFFNFTLPDMQWVKILFLAVVVFLFAYGMFAYLLRFPFSGEAKEKRSFSPVIAITAGVMFDFIYIIFSVIQIFYLFIGKFDLPAGVSYAQYARKGFFTLLVVCIFNFIIVLIGNCFFSTNKALKIVLTVMSLCTYIMTASSAFRMILYIRYYYFTFLRVLVLWALTVIAVLFVGVLISIWKTKFNIFRYSLSVVLIAYTLLAFSHTDYFVVKWNLSEVEKESSFFLADGYDDFEYMIYDTCLDSAPLVFNEEALYKYKSIYYAHHQNLNEDMSLRTFNFSVYTAIKNCNYKQKCT